MTVEGPAFPKWGLEGRGLDGAWPGGSKQVLTPGRHPAPAGTMDSEAFQHARDLLDLNFQCELAAGGMGRAWERGRGGDAVLTVPPIYPLSTGHEAHGPEADGAGHGGRQGGRANQAAGVAVVRLASPRWHAGWSPFQGEPGEPTDPKPACLHVLGEVWISKVCKAI